jgi:hypothetical protein
LHLSATAPLYEGSFSLLTVWESTGLTRRLLLASLLLTIPLARARSS